MSHHRKKQKKQSKMYLFVLVAIAFVAVRRQLALPPEERTWHGTIDVPVPYDFRIPTAARVKRSFWDPDDERIFLPRAFGIGWSVNAATVVKRLTDREL